MPEPEYFLEAPYIITFVGTTNGVVHCDSAQHLRNVLTDCFPNPGDPTLAYLLNPANWLEDSEGVPYNAEMLVVDEQEDYRIAVFRVMELVS